MVLFPVDPATHPPAGKVSIETGEETNKKRTGSRPPWDYFNLIYTQPQNWLKNALTLRTLQCLKMWFYQPEIIIKTMLSNDSLFLKFDYVVTTEMRLHNYFKTSSGLL